MALLKILLSLIGKIKMAIHDTDKNSDGRDSPMPNSHDEQGLARMAAGTTSIHPTTDATTELGFIQTKNAQILTNDGLTNRLVISPTQIKISQANNDVLNTADANLIFNSSQNVFKIVQTGTTSFNLTAANNNYTTSIDVSHSLGYAPLVLAAVTISTNGSTSVLSMLPYIQTGASSQVTGADVVFFVVKVVSFTDKIRFFFNIGGINQTASGSIKWYILQETAA